MNEKRKTENSTDQKVSVFPESRELLTCFERDTDAFCTCRSFFAAKTDRNIRAANKIFTKGRKKKASNCVSLVQMLYGDKKTALQRQSDLTNMWL